MGCSGCSGVMRGKMEAAFPLSVPAWSGRLHLLVVDSRRRPHPSQFRIEDNIQKPPGPQSNNLDSKVCPDIEKLPFKWISESSMVSPPWARARWPRPSPQMGGNCSGWIIKGPAEDERKWGPGGGGEVHWMRDSSTIPDHECAQGLYIHT